MAFFDLRTRRGSLKNKFHFFYVSLLIPLVFFGAISALRPGFLIPNQPINVGDSFFPLVYPHALFGQGVHFNPFLLSSFYFLGTCLLGLSALIRTDILRQHSKEFLLGFGLVLGFAPGYLILISVNRFLTYFFSEDLNETIYPYIFLALLLVASFEIIRFKISAKQLSPKKILQFVFSSLLILFIFLIIQIQTNLYNGLPIHIIGDSAIFNSTYLTQIATLPNLEVKLFEQHYDEIIYLAPISFIFKNLNVSINSVDWLWVTYSFMKASVFIWVFTSIKQIFAAKQTAILITVFLFFGNIFVNPLTSPLINDSASNLAASSHSGRLLIAGISIYLFSQAFAPIKKESKVLKIASLPTIFVVAFGLASLTASLIYVLGLALGVWIFIKFRNLNKNYSALTTLTLFAVVAMNYLVDAKVSLVIVFIIAFLAIYSIEFSNFKSYLSQLNLRAKVVTSTVFLVGFLIPTLFMGNLFSKSFRNSVGLDTSNYAGRDISAGFGGLGNNPYIFNEPIVMLHQQSLITFFQYYGFPIFYLAIALIYIFIRKLGSLSQTLSNVFITTAFVTFSFFLWNDLNGNNPEWMAIWVKSRLIEVTFYVWLIAIFKLLFDVSKNFANNSKIFEFFILSYLILSLFGPYPGGMLGQFVKNSTWLFDRIFG